MAELQRLHEQVAISRLLAGTSDPTLLARRAVEKATALIGADAGLLRVADGGATVASSVGLPDEIGPSLTPSLANGAVDALRTGLKAPAQDCFWERLLIHEERVVGRLTLHRVGSAPLSPDENALLDFLVEQAGPALALAVRLKQAEEAVPAARAAEVRFRSLLEAAPDPIVIVNEDGRIVLINHETERVFGYTPDELQGETVEVLLPERYRQNHIHVRNAYQAAPRTRPMGLGLDLLARRKDGSEFPVEISLSPLESEEGRLIISSIRDATEGKRREEELRRSGESLRRHAQLIELAHDAIVVRDLENRITYWNHGAEVAYGFSREQALGAVMWKLLGTRYVEPPAPGETMQATLLEHGAWEGELIHKRSGGQAVVVDARQVVQRDSEGLPQAILTINRDITDQKRAEAERIQQGAHWRLLSDTAGILLESKAPKAVLQDLFAQLAEHTGVDAYLYYGVGETGDELVLEACSGLPCDDPVLQRLPLGQASCGTASQQRTALQVANVQQSEDPRAERVRAFGFRAYACQPLLAGDCLLGTLSFASRTRDQFDPNELELFKTLTHYLAIAIERTRLLQSERHKSEELSATIREAHHRPYSQRQ